MADSRGTEVRKTILAALEAEASRHAMAIVDVEIGAGSVPAVRVRVEKEGEDGSISLDEVAEATRWIDPVVEGIDPFDGSYTLEVSSPGLDRPLRTEADFRRFAGSDVAIRMEGFSGRRNYKGHLEGVEEGCAVVICDGERHLLPLDKIQKANLVPSFD